jgi:hypothetical protein
MTTHITDRSSAQRVEPPPPFDPELAPVLEMLTSLRPPTRTVWTTSLRCASPFPGWRPRPTRSSRAARLQRGGVGGARAGRGTGYLAADLSPEARGDPQ